MGSGQWTLGFPIGFVVLLLYLSSIICAEFLTNVEQDQNWGDFSITLAPIYYPVYSAALADFDADGDVDAMVSGGYYNCRDTKNRPPAFRLYLREGGALFDETEKIVPNWIDTVSYTTKFINRPQDKRLNILAIGSSNFEIYQFGSDGTYRVASTPLFIGVSLLVSNKSNAHYVGLEITDFDGDDLQDFFLFSTFNSLAMLQLPNGSFVHSDTVIPQLPSFSSGNLPLSSTGELDGNNSTDLYLTSKFSSLTYSLMFKHLENGTYQKITLTSIPGRYSGGLTISDLNGDGYGEIIMTGYPLSDFQIYRNLRNNSFSTNGFTVFGSANVTQRGAILDFDLDLDGFTDILVTGQGIGGVGTLFLKNLHNQTFQVVPNTPFEGMMDSAIAFSPNLVPFSPGLLLVGIVNVKDQKFQVVYNNGGVLEDKTSDLFPVHRSLQTPGSGSCGVMDVNYDGCLDFYASGHYFPINNAGVVTLKGLFLGQCNGSFIPSPTTAVSGYQNEVTIWHDFDHNGFIEQLSVGENSTWYAEYYSPTNVSFFTFSNSKPQIWTGISKAVVDLNRDGYLDVIWMGGQDPDVPLVSVMRNLRNKTFVDFASVFTPPLVAYMDATIISLKNGSQLLATGMADPTIFLVQLSFRVLQPNSSYTQVNSGVYFLGKSIDAVSKGGGAVVDINQDGKEDIFLTGDILYQVYRSQLYLQVSNGTYVHRSMGQFDTMGGAFSVVNTLDVDQDGYYEIIVGARGFNYLWVLKSDENGTLQDIHEQVLPYDLGGFFAGELCTGQLNSAVDSHTDLLAVGNSNEHCGFGLLLTGQNRSNVIQATTTASESPQPDSGPSSSDDFSSGTLAGIIIAAVSGSGMIAILLVALCCCLILCLALMTLVVFLAIVCMLTILALLIFSLGMLGLGDVALVKYFRQRKANQNFSSLDSNLVAPQSISQFQSIDWSDLTVKRKLGSGAFGEVMLADWNGVEVAVKMFRISDSNVLDDFEHETALMAKVSYHPHIVKFYGVASNSSSVAIVMELCPGGSLYEALRQKHVDITSKIRILYEISSALAFLHSLGVIHRDVAARNVLLDSVGKSRLSDLGIARILAENQNEQTTSSFLGPVRWMAPESITKRLYSSASDVYSFGILMFEVFSDGDLPFGHFNSVAEVALAVGREGERPEIPSNTPADIRKWMKTLWNTAPSSRPSMETVHKWLKSHYAVSSSAVAASGCDEDDLEGNTGTEYVDAGKVAV